MTTRSVHSVITFVRPFTVGSQTEMLPAGTYNMSIDEELIEGLSFAAYHRMSTVLEVPAIGTTSPVKQYLYVAAEALDAALQRDRLGAETGIA
jgi:hypothetical protein